MTIIDIFMAVVSIGTGIFFVIWMVLFYAIIVIPSYDAEKKRKRVSGFDYRLWGGK